MAHSDVFDPLLPWRAAKAAGMLTCASWQPPMGPRRAVDVGFVSPDEQVLVGALTAQALMIEYETACMPELAVNDQLEIDGALYRVIQTPQRRDDGVFSVAELGRR